MATASRLFSTCQALQFDSFSSSSSSLNSNQVQLKFHRHSGVIWGERKAILMAKASVSEKVKLERETEKKSGVLDGAALLAAGVAGAVVKIFRSTVKRKSWRLKAEMAIEKVIIDCRFFTLIAVAGTLVGSILCFLEGCFLILESFSKYFHTMSERSDQGEMMQLLIETIDMFIMGTAMLILGMGLYVLFVGSKEMKREKGSLIPGSNFFGLFHLKRLPEWAEMQSISQGKSKIGHAVVMILQVGVLDKFKNVPLTTGFDLACFSGALLISSACILLLSRLYMEEGSSSTMHNTPCE